LVSPELRKYSKVLTNDQLRDWQTAVGLKAHGVGAGSYVYLRRIIKALVMEAVDKAVTAGQVVFGVFTQVLINTPKYSMGHHYFSVAVGSKQMNLFL
jgi:hypothetical protein